MLARVGWAERLRKRKGSPSVTKLESEMQARVIDGAVGARIAASLRESLAHYGLKAKAASPLGGMIAAADRLAANGDFQDDDREGVRLIGQAQQLAVNLKAFRSVSDPDRVVEWIVRGIDRLATPKSPALDFLFELEVAAALARHGTAFTVKAGKPDILLYGPPETGPLAIECKHPDTMSGILKRVEEGARQIREGAAVGLVMICVDTVVHGGKAVAVASPEAAKDKAATEVEKISSLSKGKLDQAFASTPQLVAVLFVLRMPYVAPSRRNPSSVHDRLFAYQAAIKVESHPANPAANGLARSITSAMWDRDYHAELMG